MIDGPAMVASVVHMLTVHLSPPAAMIRRTERDTCAVGSRPQKTADPHTGDERCLARGTTPVRRSCERPSPAQRGRNRVMQWLDNGSQLDPEILRRRLLTITTDRVWSEALGSYLLAILIPLFSVPRFSASLTPGTCPLHCR
jgi:hypothetical protein